MSKSEQQIEQEIQSKNLNAPRLTPADIDAVIVDKYYFTAANAQWGADPNTTALIGMHKQLETLTFCVLILKNGFTVTGESACASPENFDAEIGKKIAYENARNKIWQLEGYLLKENLHKQNSKVELKTGIDSLLDTRIPIINQLTDLCYAIEKCGASPEFKNDDVKSFEPSCSTQACVSGSVGSNGYQLNAKRDNAFLVAQLLSNNKISAELRKKAETKMTALLDELI